MSRIVVAVFLCCLLACALADCPPVQSAQNFNVTSYTGLWYTQMQMPVIYLPPKDNYCVTANYSLSSPTTVDVYNYANVGEVNGPAKGGPLCAIIPDPSIPSQLRVGLCHLPKATYGPYWVLEAGPDPTKQYQYALLSGGPPTIETSNGCRTGVGVDGSGLWIFTREAIPSDPTVVPSLLKSASNMGFDTSVLRPVTQEGCLYRPI